MAPTPTVEAKPGLGQETSGPDGGDQTGHSLPMDESMENADWDYAQEELMAKTGIDLKVTNQAFFGHFSALISNFPKLFFRKFLEFPKNV